MTAQSITTLSDSFLPYFAGTFTLTLHSLHPPLRHPTPPPTLSFSSDADVAHFLSSQISQRDERLSKFLYHPGKMNEVSFSSLRAMKESGIVDL